MKKFFKYSIVLIFLLAPLIAVSQLPSFDRPCGIYVLGANRPGMQLDNIRSYSFIDGYALRIDWEDIETAQGVYDFTVLDEAISQLEANHQKLTIALFTKRVPSYIPLLPNAEFYWDHNKHSPKDSILSILPWDTIHIPYLHAFLDTIGSHLVPDKSQGGTMVQFRDHPVFAQINAQFPGLGGVRDTDKDVINNVGYNRKRFTLATIKTIQMYIDLFPNQYRYVAFFGMNDGVFNPNLSTHLQTEYHKAFNMGKQPLLGYFAENLACSTPNSNRNVLGVQKNNTFTMFQMLEAWRTPHQNSGAATIPCLTDSTGPDVGMAYGLDSFNTTYFELYLSDIEWLQYNSIFTLWQDSLNTLCGQEQTTGIIENNLRYSTLLYPNPNDGIFNINIEGGKEFTFEIYTISGQLILQKKITQRSIQIDLTQYQVGMYFVRVTDSLNNFSFHKVIKNK